MSSAFVLAETTVGKTREVFDFMRKSGIPKSVHMVTGPYDIIATIDGKDQTAVDAAARKLRAIPGITRAVTCFSDTALVRSPVAAGVI